MINKSYLNPILKFDKSIQTNECSDILPLGKELVIDDTLNNNNSIVTLSESNMKVLKLSHGDFVMIKNPKNQKETICSVSADETCKRNTIRINRCIRKNLSLNHGDNILIQHLPNVPKSSSITIHFINQEYHIDLFESCLKPYFTPTNRPIKKGNIYDIDYIKIIEFEIIDCDPTPYCIVDSDTIINIQVHFLTAIFFVILIKV